MAKIPAPIAQATATRHSPVYCQAIELAERLDTDRELLLKAFNGARAISELEPFNHISLTRFGDQWEAWIFRADQEPVVGKSSDVAVATTLAIARYEKENT